MAAWSTATHGQGDGYRSASALPGGFSINVTQPRTFHIIKKDNAKYHLREAAREKRRT